jgi:hypothetical protein
MADKTPNAQNSFTLDGRAWCGRAEACNTHFFVEMAQAKKHPGYYFIAMGRLADGGYVASHVVTIKPVQAAGVEQAVLSRMLATYRLAVDEFSWKPCRLNRLLLLSDEHREKKLTQKRFSVA